MNDLRRKWFRSPRCTYWDNRDWKRVLSWTDRIRHSIVMCFSYGMPETYILSTMRRTHKRENFLNGSSILIAWDSGHVMVLLSLQDLG